MMCKPIPIKLVPSRFVAKAGEEVRQALLARFGLDNSRGCYPDDRSLGTFLYIFKFEPPDLKRLVETENGEGFTAYLEICAPKPKRWNAAWVTFEVGDPATGITHGCDVMEAREPEFSANTLVSQFVAFAKKRLAIRKGTCREGGYGGSGAGIP